MSNTFNQHGQGDNIGADKFTGDKISGDKISMSHSGKGDQIGQVQGDFTKYEGDNKSTNFQAPITAGDGANFGSGQNKATVVKDGKAATTSSVDQENKPLHRGSQ